MAQSHLARSTFVRPWAARRVFNCLLSGVLALALVASAAAQTLAGGTAGPARYIADVKALTTAPMEGGGRGRHAGPAARGAAAGTAVQEPGTRASRHAGLFSALSDDHRGQARR